MEMFIVAGNLISATEKKRRTSTEQDDARAKRDRRERADFTLSIGAMRTVSVTRHSLHGASMKNESRRDAQKGKAVPSMRESVSPGAPTAG